MRADAIVYHVVWDIAPLAFLFCVLVGAIVLCRRAPGVATVAQLIGIALVFIGHGLFKLRWLPAVAIPSDTSPMYVQALCSRPMEIVMRLAPLVGLAVFVTGYLVYATKKKNT